MNALKKISFNCPACGLWLTLAEFFLLCANVQDHQPRLSPALQTWPPGAATRPLTVIILTFLKSQTSQASGIPASGQNPNKLIPRDDITWTCLRGGGRHTCQHYSRQQGDQKDRFQPVGLREAHGPDGQTRVSVTGEKRGGLEGAHLVALGCLRRTERRLSAGTAHAAPAAAPRAARTPALRASRPGRRSALAPGDRASPVRARGLRCSCRSPGGWAPLTRGAFPCSRPTRPLRSVSSFHFG